jgi:hypothetical protein
MLAQKKMLSLEELEAQTMWELPDRELMHVSHKHGSHAHAASSPTTTTSFNCSQTATNEQAALILLGVVVPTGQLAFGNCSPVTIN